MANPGRDAALAAFKITFCELAPYKHRYAVFRAQLRNCSECLKGPAKQSSKVPKCYAHGAISAMRAAIAASS